MKSITGQELLKAGVRNLGQVKQLPKVDDREPMERVADELVNFTETVREMSKFQSDEIINILKTVVSAVEKISNQKIDIKQDPVKIVQEAMKLDLNDSRPKEWNMEVTKRDSNGMISSVKLIAGEDLE